MITFAPVATFCSSRVSFFGCRVPAHAILRKRLAQFLATIFPVAGILRMPSPKMRDAPRYKRATLCRVSKLIDQRFIADG